MHRDKTSHPDTIGRAFYMGEKPQTEVKAGTRTAHSVKEQCSKHTNLCHDYCRYKQGNWACMFFHLESLYIAMTGDSGKNSGQEIVNQQNVQEVVCIVLQNERKAEICNKQEEVRKCVTSHT